MIERINRLVKSIFVFKNWVIYFIEKFSRKKYTIFETRNGLRIKTRKGTADKGIILEIFFDKTYNPKGFEIKKDDVVIDIGAHIGIFSLYASTFTKNRIFCFEPIKENFNLLEENIRMNHKNNIKIFNFALCNQKEIRIFFNDVNTGGHSNFIEGKKYQKVKCMTLKDIFQRENINVCNFLKIDCEGCEYEILFNTPDSVFEKIKKISMEIHDLGDKNPKNMIKFLESKGYKVISKNNMIYAKR